MWSATLKVRKLEIPVGLAARRREQRLSMKRLHADCMQPIATRAWCEQHHRVLEPEEIVDAFEAAAGRYVRLDPDEPANSSGERDSTIRVSCFVKPDSVPAAAAIASYYLIPSKLPAGRRHYLLLQRALADTGLVGVSRLRWRSEWIATIAALPGTRALLLTRLSPADELVPAREIDEALAGDDPDRAEIKLARDLIRAMTRPSPPRRALRSEEQERLRELVDRALAGGDTLTHTLERSLRSSKRAHAAARHTK